MEAVGWGEVVGVLLEEENEEGAALVWPSRCNEVGELACIPPGPGEPLSLSSGES